MADGGMLEKSWLCSFYNSQTSSPCSHWDKKFLQFDPKCLKDCFGGLDSAAKMVAAPALVACALNNVGFIAERKSSLSWRNQWQVWIPHLRSRACEVSKEMDQAKNKRIFEN